MIPIVTPSEMAAIDAEALEPVDILIERAGAAVARHALRLLGGGYGRRVVVVAGPGNNGADGRVAARLLARRGVGVSVRDAVVSDAIPGCDLVIDAAFGTGLSRPYEFPAVPPGIPVLAVDIASGVHGLTGEVMGTPATAVSTLTFAALKPGLLLPPGRWRHGEVVVADIGLDVSHARAGLVEDGDVAAGWPERGVETHKWRQALLVVAGSPGMTGAAHLTCRAAFRAGAGYVALHSLGDTVGDERAFDGGAPIEVVRSSGPFRDLDLGRFGALVLGPGLGRSRETVALARDIAVTADLPLVIDGDGLWALGGTAMGAARLVKGRRAVTVLTPHDGEFERLTGARPGPDRFDAARTFAAASGAVVLLKGPTTIVAGPSGDTRLVTSGDQRLATAGTGDVLSGMIGALLATGLDALDAASLAAHVHGRAGSCAPITGAVAGDLPELVPAVLADLRTAVGDLRTGPAGLGRGFAHP